MLSCWFSVFCVCVYLLLWGTDSGNGVEGSVSADAEVRARHVVGDSGRDDHHGNAQLLKFRSGLDQLQASHIGLQGEKTGQKVKINLFVCL